MKFRYLIKTFLIVLVSTVVIRTVQMYYTIDQKTGFVYKPFRNISFYMTVAVIFLVCALTVFAFFIKRSPIKMPTPNPILGASSLLFGISLFFDIFTTRYASRVPNWQISLTVVFGILAGLFLIVYGVKGFVKFHLPRFFYVLPCLYFIAKIICAFTEISSLALTTDNVFKVCSLCASLVFMLEFAKLSNFIDIESNYRKIFASFVASALFLSVYVVPNIYLVIFTNHSLPVTVPQFLSFVFADVFVLTFGYFHFSNNNLMKRSHKSSKTKFMPSKNEDSFYFDYGHREN